MNIVKYVSYGKEYKPEFLQMIKSLYIEDPDGDKMTDEKIEKTIVYLHLHKDHGKIILLKQSNIIVGYAIIINYWSNEYGGIIFYIDELYIKSEFRGQGIGTGFIKNLINKRYNNCTAIFLEVIPSNERAYNLYAKIGFKPHKNRIISYLL
jgi:ribosomal protein S18 acetylase RimI-like enzyme